MADHQCQRCGCALRIETVQVPVYLEHNSIERAAAGLPPEQVLARYDEEKQVSDCPRCQGAY